jgi:hypothetical protein
VFALLLRRQESQTNTLTIEPTPKPISVISDDYVSEGRAIRPIRPRRRTVAARGGGVGGNRSARLDSPRLGQLLCPSVRRALKSPGGVQWRYFAGPPGPSRARRGSRRRKRRRAIVFALWRWRRQRARASERASVRA